ncbi:zinc finger and BTB domain-containing protein 24-like [Amia ocellicauda]|uniref:zinc finger and BTB domain-containing protein 24-like n=1 Tax=Amia ocellicauda TaxID=2972642 RepID=UPI0034649D87
MMERWDSLSAQTHGQAVLRRLQEQRVLGLFCDVTVLVEGGVFPAHRNVLSACSEVLHHTLSRGGDVVQLDNVSLQSFSRLLEFFYTAVLPSGCLQDFYSTAELLKVSLPLARHSGSLCSDRSSLAAPDRLSHRTGAGRAVGVQEVCEQHDGSCGRTQAGGNQELPPHLQQAAIVASGHTEQGTEREEEKDQNPAELNPRTKAPDTFCPPSLIQGKGNDNGDKSSQTGTGLVPSTESLSVQEDLQNTQEEKGVRKDKEISSPKLVDCQPWMCEACDSHSRQLVQHRKQCRAEKTYQCDQCGKQLGSMEKLKDHVAYHSDARPHRCQLCDKAYKVKNDLTQHVRAKHGEAWRGKPALVQLCEFCGQEVQHYKSHKVFCSGVKRFPCRFCVQTFYRLSELKRHTWTHTGELPYRCTICGKRCRHPSNLKKHIRSVHKEDVRVRIDREHASPKLLQDFLPLEPSAWTGHPCQSAGSSVLAPSLSLTRTTAITPLPGPSAVHMAPTALSPNSQPHAQPPSPPGSSAQGPS